MGVYQALHNTYTTLDQCKVNATVDSLYSSRLMRIVRRDEKTHEVMVGSSDTKVHTYIGLCEIYHKYISTGMQFLGPPVCASTQGGEWIRRIHRIALKAKGGMKICYDNGASNLSFCGMSVADRMVPLRAEHG